MSSTENTKPTDTSVQKAESNELDSVIKLLTNVSTQNSESISKINEKLDKLVKADANPVATGNSMENQPKVSDPKDVGDPVVATNDYGHSTQPSINVAANQSSGTDQGGLSQETNKADAEKKEGKEEKEVEKAKTVKKSGNYAYVDVTPLRPRFTIMKNIPDSPPTAYQVLKAIESGWGGETRNADESLEMAINKFEDGEFGTGWPKDGY